MFRRLHSRENFSDRIAARARRARGFTLVEVSIAAAVLALCLTGSLLVLQRGFMAIDNARYTTLAGQILQSQMEKLRMLTWAQLTSTTSGPPTNGAFSPDLSSSSSGQLANFTCTETIAAAPSPYASTMVDITLTATWKGSDGRSRSLSYFTRYGQNGVSDFFYTSH
ncbi:MAG TPA: prepilin-type N-terminal cleavage/methylation domain-containing protein [Opitutaceae bacterium]|nr:prepilin-type N-terminal cleavage/methylation domain-containing protein [Opitutaceae bacterium]